MIRRKFLEYSSKSLLSLGLGLRFSPAAEGVGRSVAQNAASSASAEEVLPGTAPLTQHGDWAEQMEEGIQRFLRGRIEEVPQERARLWQRDYRSAKDYEALSNKEHCVVLAASTSLLLNSQAGREEAALRLRN